MERTFTAGVSIVQLFANARAAGASVDLSRLTAADEAQQQRNVTAARAAARIFEQSRPLPMPGMRFGAEVSAEPRVHRAAARPTLSANHSWMPGMRFGGEEPQPATKVVSAHAGRPPLLPSGHYAMPGVSFGADAPVVRAHAGQARTAARSSTHAPMPGIQLGA